MTPPVDIQRLRSLMEAATAGPWSYREGPPSVLDDLGKTRHSAPGGTCYASIGGNSVAVVATYTYYPGNAALIVAAVNALPALLAELEAARVLAKMVGIYIHIHHRGLGRGDSCPCEKCTSIVTALNAYDAAVRDA